MPWAWLCWALAAQTEVVPDTAEQAVAIARYAFEYRDFEKVRALLDPWLHPPRIVDPRLMIEARRLMGVSLHVLGQGRAADEEFAQLLLLDPKHALDPFVVPPEVIASFEGVRARMSPTLTPRLEPKEPPPPAPQVQYVMLPHPAVALLPLGLPQWLRQEWLKGAIYGLLQLTGLGLNITGFLQADGAERGTTPFHAWRGAQYGGLALFLGAWITSGIDGWRQVDAEHQRLQAKTSP